MKAASDVVDGVTSDTVCVRCGDQVCVKFKDSHEDATVRCNGQAAERCIFCHNANLEQYVPLHFEGTGAAAIIYSDALSAHRACASCWGSWERRQALQFRPGVHPKGMTLCPVCQRYVDVRKAYDVHRLCADCLDAVVLKTAPFTERAAPKQSCCSRTFCVIVIFVIFLSFGAICQQAMRISLEHVIKGLDDESLPLVLPQPYLEILCPSIGLVRDLSLTSSIDPLMTLIVEFGAKVCGSHQRRHVAGRIRQTQESRTSINPSDRGLSFPTLIHQEL